MARFYENSMNQPSRPQRPSPRPMPPGPMPPPTPPPPPMPPPRQLPTNPIMPSPRPQRPSGSMPRQLPTNPIMPSPRPQRPMSPPMPMPPGLEGQDRLMPPAGSFDRQAGQSMREGLNVLMSLLATPSRVARGAVEGGAQAVNPDFEVPDIEARLRAYLRQMQGGE